MKRIRHLEKWLRDHPYINTHLIEAKLGIPYMTLNWAIKKNTIPVRTIPEKYVYAIEMELVEYGFEPL